MPCTGKYKIKYKYKYSLYGMDVHLGDAFVDRNMLENTSIDWTYELTYTFYSSEITWILYRYKERSVENQIFIKPWVVKRRYGTYDNR